MVGAFHSLRDVRMGTYNIKGGRLSRQPINTRERSTA